MLPSDIFKDEACVPRQALLDLIVCPVDIDDAQLDQYRNFDPKYFKVDAGDRTIVWDEPNYMPPPYSAGQW